MSAESHSQQAAPDFDYTVFCGDGTVYRHWKGGEFITKVEAETYSDLTDPLAPAFTFEHDKQRRLFILKWPAGRTEHFRDNPARQLMVEPDPESDTGEMRPVIKCGRPVYVYLCREERELQ